MKTSTMKQNKAVTIYQCKSNKHGFPDMKYTPNQKMNTQNRNAYKT